MNKFIIVFYNRFACQSQTFKVIAQTDEDAVRIFYLKYPKEQFHDCIENIEEVHDHWYTETEIRNSLKY